MTDQAKALADDVLRYLEDNGAELGESVSALTMALVAIIKTIARQTGRDQNEGAEIVCKMITENMKQN